MEHKKTLSQYLIPNIFSMVGLSFYILVDTFFISVAAGTKGITALNLALPIYGIMYGFGGMIGIGHATRYSLDKKDNPNKANTYLANSLLFCLGLSMIGIGIGLFYSKELMHLLGGDASIIQTGLSYMRVILLFAPGYLCVNTFSSFIRNDHDPGLAMIASIISSLSNIVLDYIFMFPMKMGMYGAGLATSLSPFINIAICSTHFLKKDNQLKFQLSPNIKTLLMSCMLGISSFISEVGSSMITLVFNFLLLGLVGNIGVAAYGIVANISLMVIAIFNGISQGLQPLTSLSVAKNDEHERLSIYKKTTCLGLIIALVIIIAIYFNIDFIIAFFNSEGSLEMPIYARNALKLYSLGFIFASLNIIRAGYFSASDQAKQCSLISILRGFVMIIPCGFILSKLIGINGVWLSFLASELVTYLISIGFKK